MKYYIIVFAFYIISAFIGYTHDFTELKENLATNHNLQIENSFFIIVYNNFKLLLINIISCLSFGIISLINIIINGYLFGRILRIISDTDMYFYFLSYSIFESLGIIISAKIGIDIGIKLFKNTFGGKIVYFSQKLKYEITLCIVLILIGAIIESDFII